MNDAERDEPPIESYDERPGPEPEKEPERDLSDLMNADAELAVLGTLMASPGLVDLIDGILKPEHFAFTGHSKLFRLCCDAITTDQTANPITIKHELEMARVFEPAGGGEWFSSLIAAQTGKMSATGLAKIIRDLYYRRQLSNLGHELQERALEVEGDAGELIEDAERDLSELVGNSATNEARTRSDAVNSTLGHLESSYNNPGALTGASTGLHRLDARLLGLQSTDLIILAGRPSMGKTALAQRFAESNANQFEKTEGAEGVPALFFSLEMSAEQINMRLISERANVPLEHMRSGKYHSKDDWHKVVNAAQAMKSLPLYIDDSGGLTSRGIWARARRMKRKHNIGLIIVDQLSHIRWADPKMRKVDAYGQICKDMKAMAKELEVPVVLLSQLSRGVEARDDKRPMLSDLRDSGEIEQDADVVLFVYREQYYLERSTPSQKSDETPEKFGKRLASWESNLEAAKNTAEVIIGKQRMGDIGKAVVGFHGAYTRFCNIDNQHNTDQSEFDMK